MPEIIPEFELSIPEKCLPCPAVRVIRDHIDLHEKQKESITEFAVSDKLDEFAARYYDQVSNVHVDRPSSCEEVSKGMRADAADQLDFLDQHIDGIKEQRKRLVTGCAGSLGMRAIRDGINFTVRVCTSPSRPNEEDIEPASVLRTPT